MYENNTMFSVKERPWHCLGKVIQNAPNIVEGIQLAGLDWNVELENLISSSGIVSNTNRMSVRVNKDGIKQELGCVGKNYTPVQNLEAFNFFEPFIESKLVSLEIAGSFFNGKKIFILAKVNFPELEVIKDDIVENYILLSNAHDGTRSLWIGFTPIRIVCDNILKMAKEDEASQLIRLKHTYQIQNNLTEIRSIMDLVNIQFMTTIENYKYLALRDINSSDLKKYVNKVFSKKKLEDIIDNFEEQELEQKTRLINQIEEIFEKEPTKTLWSGYNAISFYIQHCRGNDIEKRYNSLWFQSGDYLNKRALSIALNW